MIFINIYSAACYIFNQDGKKAQVKFIVADFSDNAPVSFARVCIPEINASFFTDNSGNTPLIEVPVMPDAFYDGICKRNFGEITVIVYKEGYADYILCNLCIRENDIREGIKLLIYKKDNFMPDFTPIVETPDVKWLKELIEKYRKY